MEDAASVGDTEDAEGLVRLVEWFDFFGVLANETAQLDKGERGIKLGGLGLNVPSVGFGKIDCKGPVERLRRVSRYAARPWTKKGDGSLRNSR
jgi:hypothetical protein